MKNQNRMTLDQLHNDFNPKPRKPLLTLYILILLFLVLSGDISNPISTSTSDLSDEVTTKPSENKEMICDPIIIESSKVFSSKPMSICPAPATTAPPTTTTAPKPMSLSSDLENLEIPPEFDLPLSFSSNKDYRKNRLKREPKIQFPRKPPPHVMQQPTYGFQPSYQPFQHTLRPRPPMIPPVFDPRLSTTERSSLLMQNSMETPMSVIMPTFPVVQPAPMPIPRPAPFIPSVQLPFPPIMPVPPMVPPVVPPAPPPQQPPKILEEDDGLEDMMEAMEFAQQLMSMGDDGKKEKEEENKIQKSVHFQDELKVKFPEELNIPPYQEELKIPSFQEEPKIPSFQEELKIPSFQEVLKIPSFQEELKIPSFQEELKIPSFQEELKIPVFQEELKIPSFQEASKIEEPKPKLIMEPKVEAVKVDIKKPEPPPPITNPELSWKNRVLSRFLKMSKNEIRNMLNNSSLRKFNLAMNHLVKEKRSSLSQETRINENERMKEYDREEFMNQLNAMLDPNAVVDITNLPTAFIHHLNEVLQLDPLQFSGTEGGILGSDNIQSSILPPTSMQSDLMMTPTIPEVRLSIFSHSSLEFAFFSHLNFFYMLSKTYFE